MARKKKEAAPAPGSPAWMATFSDMVTLILTFFVLLYSFSSLDAKKFKATAEALSGQPSVFMDQASIIDQAVQETAPQVRQEELAGAVTEATEWESIYGDISQELSEQSISEGVTLAMTEGEIHIRLPGDVVFDIGSDVIKPELYPILDDILTTIALHSDFVISTIRVEGHTDNLPIRTAQFPDNQYLSMRRAYSVDNYIRQGYPQFADLLLTGGYGETRPVASNDTPEGRAANRRVELVLMRSQSDINNPLTAGAAEQMREAESGRALYTDVGLTGGGSNGA